MVVFNLKISVNWAVYLCDVEWQSCNVLLEVCEAIFMLDSFIRHNALCNVKYFLLATWSFVDLGTVQLS